MNKIAKAIAAAVSTFGAGITTASLDGGIVANEWWGILGGTLVAGAAVYLTPNG